MKSRKLSGLGCQKTTEIVSPSQLNSCPGSDIAAWLCGFFASFKTLQRNERIVTRLKVLEICQEEEVLIKRAQSVYIEYFKSKKGLPSRSHLLPLRLFLGADGFLRVGGRLRKSPLPETARNLIILDPSHAVTRLIIAHYHQRLYCSGVEHVLNELRQQYWILKGLPAVMKASSTCVLCRLRRSCPCPPVMADCLKHAWDMKPRLSPILVLTTSAQSKWVMVEKQRNAMESFSHV